MSEAKPVTPSQNLRNLANETLYVLQHCQFRGEDSHRIELVKAWMTDLRDNVSKQIEAEAKAATEAANKPVEPVLSEAK